MRQRLYMAIALGMMILAASAMLATPPSMATGELTGVKVCLDAGHGGSDPGAVNLAFGLEEADINLEVAHALKSLLAGSGAAVIMTRQGDSSLTNSDRYNFCNREAATILVSVHTNSVADNVRDGTLALYMKKADVPLAQAVHDAAWASLQPDWSGSDPFVDFGLTRFASGVLLKSTMPSTIAEPMFMSNADEAARLTQPVFDDQVNGVVAPGCAGFSCRRGRIAVAIHQGVLKYFSSVVPAPTPTPAPTRCRGKSCD